MNPAPVIDQCSRLDLPSWTRLVLQKVENLQFGFVQITVHDGRVTQVECTEKFRVDSAPRPH